MDVFLSLASFRNKSHLEIIYTACLKYKINFTFILKNQQVTKKVIFQLLFEKVTNFFLRWANFHNQSQLQRILIIKQSINCQRELESNQS